MMQPFLQHSGIAAPILRDNVDTDAIIPSREMKRVSKDGLGEGLFAGWRYRDAESREPEPGFVLNRPAYAGATVLLSGANFGCGSSREHAVWALREFGIRAIFAPSFGAIFASNCIGNGLLPVVLAESDILTIARWAECDPPTHRVLIDLPQQTLTAGECSYRFDIDAGSKRMLVQGLDAIALTQTRAEQITRFHAARKLARPWLY